MARGKLPASAEFHDGGYRFRRLKRGEPGRAFSILVRMPADSEHDAWWWSKPKKVTLDKPDDKTQLLSLADAYRDELMSETTDVVTVSSYIERWQKNRDLLVRAGDKKQATIDRERTTIAYIERYLGDIPLSELTTKDVDEAYMRMIRDDVSQSTRARVHAKLRQIMKRAVRDGMLHENPVIGADAPAMPARDNERYQDRRVTIDDADALMSTLQAEPRSGLRAAIWLAYTMGLRRGEALGLRWSDIDERRMMVTIHRQMTRHGVVAVKTQASDAELPITAPVLRYLLEWRDVQIQQLRNAWTRDTYVCTNENGAAFKNNFNRGLRHYFVSHGMGEWVVDDDGKKHYRGATLHSLRHTYATSLVRAGVDIRTAKALMRHARIQTTLDIYADAENSAMRDAAVSHALHIASDADTGVVDPDDIAAHEAWIEEMDG